MIGGTDIEFWVGEGVPVADVIFRTIRRYWPDYVIENALDDSPPIKARSKFEIPTPPSAEFFIYRDEQAAHDWEEHGSRPENANSMVYVILGERKRTEYRLRSVTVVVGSKVGDIQQFVNQLNDLFREVTIGIARNSNETEAHYPLV